MPIMYLCARKYYGSCLTVPMMALSAHMCALLYLLRCCIPHATAPMPWLAYLPCLLPCFLLARPFARHMCHRIESMYMRVRRAACKAADMPECLVSCVHAFRRLAHCSFTAARAGGA